MEYFLSAFVPLVAVFGIAATAATVLLVPFHLHHRAKDRARLYEMLKQAQESNHPFSPDLIREIVGAPPPTREKDIRRGAILLAIAVGLAIPTFIFWGLLSSFRGDFIDALVPRSADVLVSGIFAMIGAVISVLACTGATLLVLGFTLRRRDKD